MHEEGEEVQKKEFEGELLLAVAEAVLNVVSLVF
jgi:hypothetical protein